MKCSKPVSKRKPIIQYALMIDAGSTGSRIHVYRFNNCRQTPELEHEEFKMTKPGLSSFKEDAEGAAESLDTLLDVAMRTIPDKLKACSPIAVKATAGLRLLGDEMSNRILDAVRIRLENKYPFPVVAGDGVSIMDGKDEGRSSNCLSSYNPEKPTGVYAWITTNYLLGKIGSAVKNPTAAIFDLGGGSTQIVFEPTFPAFNGEITEQLAAGDHRYELAFGGQNFALYQHSHLGLGLMEARKSIHREVLMGHVKSANLDPSEISKQIGPVLNPCINAGMFREVEIKLEKDSAPVKVNMTGPRKPAVAQCRFLAEAILHKEAKCETMPCSFNGIYQPALERTFAREDIYVFSYFYDRLRPLGMPNSFTLQEMKETTARVCGGSSSWDVFKHSKEAMDELTDRPEYCLDLSFMIALLHTGYELPIDREVKIAKKIKENELGWCLGASLPLLQQESGGWKCKLKQLQ